MQESRRDSAATSWHYDRDEYFAVRLAPNEREESRLLRDVANLGQESLAVDEGACRTVAVFLVRQCMLWAALAEKVADSGYWMTSAYDMAAHVTQTDTALSATRVLRDFGVRHDEVRRDARRGGLLFSARQFERMAQLGHADLAVQSLVSLDLDAILDRLDRAPDDDGGQMWRRSVDGCRRMWHALRTRMLPVAFATLWIWKGHVRSRGLWHEDEDERVVLWRCALRLYALFAPLDEAVDFQVAPTDLAGVFHGNVSNTADIVLDTPILQQSLKQLWATWSAVTWREPGLTVGSDFHCCVRLMTLRVAFLATYSGDRATFDYMRYVHAPEINLDRDVCDMELTVNRAFLVDTERTFNALIEASLTARYLAPDASAPVLRAPPEKHRRWHERVHAELNQTTESFVQRQIERHGWDRYVYWDEVERALVKTHSHSTMPRKALSDFRQADLEAVLDVLRGRNPLSLLWESALATVEEDRQQRAAAMPHHPEAEREQRGWAWRLTWDIRREREQTRDKQAHLPNDVREVVDEASGETHYVDRSSRRRVRGEALQRILMSKSVESSAAGRVAKNLLEEVVLKALLFLEKKGGGDAPPLIAFSTYKHKKHLTLAHLLSRGTQPPHKMQDRLLHEHPVLISHHNSFYVFDGEVSYARTENLLDAMYAWCLVCENLVREQLSEASRKLDPDAAAEANEQLLRDAAAAVGQIPSSLRSLFDLERDPLSMQPLANHYRLPEDVELQSCAWDNRNIVAFFVRHHPELEVSRTFIATQRCTDQSDSSYGRAAGMSPPPSSSSSSEHFDADDSLADLFAGDQEEEEEEEEEDSYADAYDVGQILGGIAL